MVSLIQELSSREEERGDGVETRVIRLEAQILELTNSDEKILRAMQDRFEQEIHVMREGYGDAKRDIKLLEQHFQEKLAWADSLATQQHQELPNAPPSSLQAKVLRVESEIANLSQLVGNL